MSTARITTEKLSLIEKCLQDGWPFAEIMRTHQVAAKTLRRHFPGQGWTPKQGAQLGYKIMKAGKT